MKQMKRTIYVDYAATTPVDPRVLAVVKPYFTTRYGNTESLHAFGRAAKHEVEKSRGTIARAIGALPEEIIFTGSATESNNTAIKGIARANVRKGKHVLVSAIEHDCVLESAQWLSRQGYDVEYIPVDTYGMVNPRTVEKMLRTDTILVSVMHASNEIGTIQPISQIGALCAARGICFHVDAAQTLGKLPINVGDMNIDALTASSHKLYGPLGVALLYVHKGIQVEPLMHGGGHEFGLRSSTLNTPGIVGFSKAVALCKAEMEKEAGRLQCLRDRLINGITRTIPHTVLNGHPQKRLPNNVNISFSFIEGEAIAMELDAVGIAVSTGSACASSKLTPSHVLRACAVPPERIHGSVRMSLGRWTNRKDIDTILTVLPGIIKRLRRISPFCS